GAASTPAQKTFADPLGPPLIDIGEGASAYLLESSRALASRCPPPSLKAFDETLTTFNSQLMSLRRQGLTRTLSIDEAEQLFALGFALCTGISQTLSAVSKNGRGQIQSYRHKFLESALKLSPINIWNFRLAERRTQ